MLSDDEIADAVLQTKLWKRMCMQRIAFKQLPYAVRLFLEQCDWTPDKESFEFELLLWRVVKLMRSRFAQKGAETRKRRAERRKQHADKL